MNNLIIVGAGGFGREVYSWLRDRINHCVGSEGEGFQLKGFLSNNPNDLNDFKISIGILGDPDEYVPEQDDQFVLAIGNIADRKRIVMGMKDRGARFFTLIHPTAVVADSAVLGDGVVICPFAVVSANVILGDFTMLNFYASCGHDAHIGNFCVLSPYATVNGFSILEDEVFLGTHTTVIAEKRVGFRAKVSANSVVTRDTPAHNLVVGVPGKNWAVLAE